MSRAYTQQARKLTSQYHCKTKKEVKKLRSKKGVKR